MSSPPFNAPSLGPVQASCSLTSGLALTPGSDPESASSFLREGFVLAVWSSCLWPAAVRGKELAVDLSNTPDSTSSNAWPTRPRQARTRYIPSMTILRVSPRAEGGGCAHDRIAH